MKTSLGKIGAVCLVAVVALTAVPAIAQTKYPFDSVEVVFVLDATGSMSGLIEGAKKKIWSIANTVVELDIAPQGKIGLIAYRDRGDDYVTIRYDLSDDLDTVFSRLQSFAAEGGGDAPESVNQALSEAVRLSSWATQTETLKIIFLVGDAPPHLDYKDDVHYGQTCIEAVQKGIIINTVQCGSDNRTRNIWREIARLGRGDYVALEQSGGMTTIATPYDAEILRLTGELGRTVVAYGDAETRALTQSKLAAATSISADVAADRAAFNLSTGGKVIQGQGDLVADWKAGAAAIEQLDSARLPEELRSLSQTERVDYLKTKQAKRDSLNFRLADLTGDRAAYLEREKKRQAQAGGGDAFDTRVTEILAAQAARERRR